MKTALKPYPKYKDTGIEWVEEIPEHWDILRLKHIAAVTLSGVDKKTEDGEQPVKLCNYTDVYYNEYITDSIEFMDATASQNEVDYATLHKGDVLVTKDSETPDDIAIPTFVKTDLKNVLCGYHLAQLRPKTGITHGEFLFRLFCSHTLREQFTPRANGITRYGVGKYNIDNSIFPLPSYTEQTSIAAYLERKTAQIDTLVDKKQKMIDLLKEYRTAVINNAVTKGLNPRVKMKDSDIEWLGEIPEHWEVRKLGYIAVVKARLGWKGLKASEYVDEGYIFLSTPNIKTKYIDFDNVNYISDERYFESPEIMLQEGDVLLAKDGSTLGTANVVKKLPSPTTVNSSIAVIRAKDPQTLDSVYLLYFMQSDFTQNVIQRIKGGMGVPHLFQEDLRNFIVILPPLKEQRSIANHIDKKTDAIDSLIEKEEISIFALKQYRTAIISNAVTGKIDVRDRGNG